MPQGNREFMFLIKMNILKFYGFILLITLCCFTVIYAGWQWKKDWQLAHQTVAFAVNKKPDETNENIAKIVEAHLFGQNISKLNGIPISNLNLRVTGLILNNGQANKSSKVMISISGQTNKIYKVGDMLPDGVKVYAITPNTIILENNGQFEKLSLGREPLHFKLRNTKEF